jgi:protein O-mannosyl-transferase
VLYSNSLFNEFMRDDYSTVVKNPLILNIQNIPRFFFGSIFYGGDEATLIGRYYRPVQAIYFTLIASTFGLNNVAFHFFQIILHTVNSILIYILFERFFKRYLAFFMATIFLVHPINTEAVVYVANAQESLFMLFGLIALLLSFNKKINIYRFSAIGISLFLSLLSKETGILFFVSILIYIFLYNRKYIWRYLALTVGIVSIYCLMRFSAIGFYTRLTPSAPIMKANFSELLLNIPLIIYYYLKTFFFPDILLINQSWIVKSVNFNDFYKPLFFDLALIGLIALEGIILLRNHKANFREYIFFLSIFLFGIAFHLHVIPLDMTVADRWFYFPIVGLIGLIGLPLSQVKIKNQLTSKLIICLSFLLLLLLSVRVVYRNMDWKNEYTLVSHDIKYSRESYHLEQNLGNYYYLKKDYKKAIYHYKKSVQIFPYFSNYVNMGTTYSALKDYPAAEQAYKKALGIGKFYLAYEQLAGLYYLRTENFKLAKDTSLEGLQRYPNNPKLLTILTFSYYRLNNLKNAKKSAALCYNRAKVKDCYKIYYGIAKNLPIKID